MYLTACWTNKHALINKTYHGVKYQGFKAANFSLNQFISSIT